MPAHRSTTVRVSRRTHQLLTELAERRGASVTDLLDVLLEQARRQEILSQYNARMGEILSTSDGRDAWADETARSEATTAELGPDATADTR